MAACGDQTLGERLRSLEWVISKELYDARPHADDRGFPAILPAENGVFIHVKGQCNVLLPEAEFVAPLRQVLAN